MSKGNLDNAAPGATSPLVHIGYHKTATSWLQQRLFSNSEYGFAMLPRPEVEKIVAVNALQFDPASVGAQLGQWAQDVVVGGHIPVISHERLSGYPHSGGFDSKEIAHRLNAVFPNARILIVVREQASTILSNYRQYIVDGGALSLKNYLAPAKAEYGIYRVPQMSLEFYEYYLLVAEYIRLFGNDQVLVLPYELLGEDSAEFLRRVANFAGVQYRPAAEQESWERVNVGLSPIGAALLRHVNHWFSRNPLNPAPFIETRVVTRALTQCVRKIDRYVPKAVKQGARTRQRSRVLREIDGKFARGNDQLCQNVTSDLRRFSYQRDTSEE